MEKRRVCLVMPTLQAGGSERVMSELAGYFCQKENLNVELILYGKDPEIFYPVPENLKIHLPKSEFKDRFRFYYTIERLLFLRKTVRKIKPDTVLSFGELWNSFVLIALAGLHLPVYISDRCSPTRSFNAFHTLLRNLLYPGAAGIIVQTRKAQAIYQSKFRHTRIEVIGNPIRSIEPRNGLKKENIVLMVGRLIKTKHQDKLIELFIRLSKPGWKLVIVGYDHLKQNNSQKLRSIIAENNAQEYVYLEGKKANVEEYYLKSRIFAFTSSSEGFPNVIGEAMSAGLPAVAFDCTAGPSEMITDGYNGFLVPLFDYAQFEEKLEKLMIDEVLREKLGANARDSIKRFSCEKVCNDFYEFILQTGKVSDRV